MRALEGSSGSLADLWRGHHPLLSPEICSASHGLYEHLDGPHRPKWALEMGGWDRLREGLQVSVYTYTLSLQPGSSCPRGWVQRQEELLGLAEGLASWGPICLVFLGTGDQSSRMTGSGMGLGEARTVPTSQVMAAGMTMSAGGPTAGSVRQSWTGTARGLLSPNLFPQCLHLSKGPHLRILLSGGLLHILEDFHLGF